MKTFWDFLGSLLVAILIIAALFWSINMLHQVLEGPAGVYTFQGKIASVGFAYNGWDGHYDQSEKLNIRLLDEKSVSCRGSGKPCWFSPLWGSSLDISNPGSIDKLALGSTVNVSCTLGQIDPLAFDRTLRCELISVK